MNNIKIRFTAFLSAIVLSFVGVLSYTQISVSAEDLPGKIIFYNQDFNDDWMNEYYIRDKEEINQYLSVLYSTSDYIEFKNNHDNVYILIWNTCFTNAYYLNNNSYALGYGNYYNEIYILVSAEPINFTNLKIGSSYNDLTYRASPDDERIYKNYAESFNMCTYDIDYGNNDYLGYGFNSNHNGCYKLPDGNLSKIKFSNIKNCDLNNIIIASNYNYSIENEFIDRYDPYQMTSDFSVSVTPTPEINMNPTVEIIGKRDTITQEVNEFGISVNWTGEKDVWDSEYMVFVTEVDVNNDSYTFQYDGNSFCKPEMMDNAIYFAHQYNYYYDYDNYTIQDDISDTPLAKGQTYSFQTGGVATGVDGQTCSIKLNEFKFKKNKTYYINVVATKSIGINEKFGQYGTKIIKSDFKSGVDDSFDFYDDVGSPCPMLIYSVPFSFTRNVQYTGSDDGDFTSFDSVMNIKPEELKIYDDKIITPGEYEKEYDVDYNYGGTGDTHYSGGGSPSGINDFSSAIGLLSTLRYSLASFPELIAYSKDLFPSNVYNLFQSTLIVLIVLTFTKILIGVVTAIIHHIRG